MGRSNINALLVSNGATRGGYGVGPASRAEYYGDRSLIVAGVS